MVFVTFSLSRLREMQFLDLAHASAHSNERQDVVVECAEVPPSQVGSVSLGLPLVMRWEAVPSGWMTQISPGPCSPTERS